MSQPLRILYAGVLSRGQLCRVRLEALKTLGAEVHGFDYEPYEDKITANPVLRVMRRVRRSLLHRGFNADLRKMAGDLAPEILYVDKGEDIEGSTLALIRQDAERAGRRVLILHFHPDHAFHPRLRTAAYEGAVAEYDCHFSPHSWVIDDHYRRGAKKVVFLPFGFDPESHFREYRFDTESDSAPDVVFVGSWEKERGLWIRDLGRSGVTVDLWGPRWARRARGQTGLRYRGAFADFATQRKAFGTARISLGVLSCTNHDGHTSRTFELPACGGFMLGERTTGQCEFFTEGREMGGFKGPQEMLEQVRYYLENVEEREAIREAGHRRCIESGYDYVSRMRQVLEVAAELNPELAGRIGGSRLQAAKTERDSR